MKINDYKKYEGRWICNRCKEFIPQIKIRRASRKADKKRNSFCQKCRIEGTQFSLKRTYPISAFLAWCVWAYFFVNVIIDGVDYDWEGNYITFKGWIHSLIAPVFTGYLGIQIIDTYAQRRSRRTIRKLSRESNKTSTKEKAHLPKEVRRAR